MNRYKHTASALILLSIVTSCANINSEKGSLEELKKYAESYEPDAPESLIPRLPDPPPEIVEILETSPINEEFSKYVCLIILKLDRWYREHAHQGFDLRENGPISQGEKPNVVLLAFARIAQIDTDYIYNGEGVLSSMASSWVNLHPYYGQYEPIYDELRRINDERESMRESLYNMLREEGSRNREN